MTEDTKHDRAGKLAKTDKPHASAAYDQNTTTHSPRSEKVSNSPHEKPATKAARVMSLLQRHDGATLGDLEAETGWQAHTTRAALTGLRKKGHFINSDKVDGVRRYRLGGPQ